MKHNSFVYVLLLVFLVIPVVVFAGTCAPNQCVPERPIPPESIGGVGIPFDLPIWPTIIKTEFHILPWLSFGKASVCLPGCSKPISLPAPCLSMKPIPVWFPWLRPLDIECEKPNTCRIP